LLEFLNQQLPRISKLRGRIRWQILIKGPSAGALSPVADAVERAARALKGNVRASLDVDPCSSMLRALGGP
jgi:primosomal protein N' (replication factor Y)